MQGGSSSGSQVPGFAQSAAQFIFGGKHREDLPGFPGIAGSGSLAGDVVAGAEALDFGEILGQLGLSDLVGRSELAGQQARQIGAGATERALGGARGIVDQGQALGSQISPDIMAQALQFLSGGQAAAGNAAGAVGSAQQILANVLNPTRDNELFQSAFSRVGRSIDDSAAARGLGEGGITLQARREAGQELSDAFAERQFQEQLQASQGLQSATGLQGQLAAVLSSLPAEIQGQLLQNLGIEGQLLGAEQQVLGQGLDIFRSAQALPLESAQDAINIARGPQTQLGQLLTGTVGQASSSPTRGIFGIRK